MCHSPLAPWELHHLASILPSPPPAPQAQENRSVCPVGSLQQATDVDWCSHLPCFNSPPLLSVKPVLRGGCLCPLLDLLGCEVSSSFCRSDSWSSGWSNSSVPVFLQLSEQLCLPPGQRGPDPSERQFLAGHICRPSSQPVSPASFDQSLLPAPPWPAPGNPLRSPLPSGSLVGGRTALTGILCLGGCGPSPSLHCCSALRPLISWTWVHTSGEHTGVPSCLLSLQGGSSDSYLNAPPTFPW